MGNAYLPHSTLIVVKGKKIRLLLKPCHPCYGSPKWIKGSRNQTNCNFNFHSMKMPWKRPRSHESHEDHEESKKNLEAFSLDSRSSYKVSSIFSISNLSRVLSSQFLSNGCTSNPLKTLSPPPNLSSIFNAKPRRPPQPNKCQKRWEDLSHSNGVGLGFVASIPNNQLLTMPTIVLDGSWKAKNIVQRHRFVVVDHARSSALLRNDAEENSGNGILFISPPSIADFGTTFYPTRLALIMSYCHVCDKKITRKDDIYVYSEKAFCSEECREEEMLLEGMILKKETSGEPK